MMTMGDKYAGLYTGTFEDIPELPENFTDRVSELQELDTAENNEIDIELVALAMLFSANVMKNAVWDDIDDNKQRSKALSSMDCFIGKLNDIWKDWKEYLA